MIFYDFLYGPIELGPYELKLCQTESLSRLKDVSLSAIPPIFIVAGDFTSRLKHSVGVAHLAKILCTKPDFKSFERELVTAALLHDAGSPPFSHATEHFLEVVTGKNHEDFAEDMLEKSDIAALTKKKGLSLRLITSIIKGEHQPLGKLINGSIDLDNLDNSLRYGLSGGILREKLYEPEHLALSFTLQGGQIRLLKGYLEEIDKWELCREKVYEFVYSDTNLSPGMMLFRALEFAYGKGELKKEFFSLSDSQALEFLKKGCNRRTVKLVEDIACWRFFQLAAKLITKKPSPKVKELCSSRKWRAYLADSLAKKLKISREEICVYTGQDKGYKKIDIPFIGPDGTTSGHKPKSNLRWIIKIYIHPRYKAKFKKAQSLLEELAKKKVTSSEIKSTNLW